MSNSDSHCVETSAADESIVAQSFIPAPSATLLADEPKVCRSRAGGAHRGRLSREALVLRDGPPVLCVLLATLEGRWHAEFTSMARGGEALRFLCAANGVADMSDFVMDTLAARGLAVLRAWRFCS